jgi:hypothetical protein
MESEYKKMHNFIKIGIAFIAWLILFSAGTFMSFVPNMHIVIFSLICAFILTIYIYKKALTLTSEYLSSTKLKTFKVKIIKVFFIAIVLMFLYETIAKPIPYLINIFIGEESQESTVVVEKDYSTGRSGLRHYIITENREWFIIGRGFTVSEDQYRQLQIGDRIYLKGKISFLGFNVKSIEKAQ